MKRKTIPFLAGLLILLGMTATAGAQEMKELTARQKAIAPIAAFTAQGNIPSLKTALSEGLAAGLTVNEIKEVLVQMYAYTGFPRSLNGLAAFSEVMDERAARGVQDVVGREPGPRPAGKTSYELGEAVQTQISGGRVEGGLMDFAPAIDEYLKAHLFGDIFARDILDFQEREIATVSALASLPGLESQLRAHCGIAMNVGLSQAQLEDLVRVLADKVGPEAGNRAGQQLKAALAARR